MRQETEWLRVTNNKPCPICQRNDWCTRTADGTLVRCMRVESDRACAENVGGWIHALENPLEPEQPKPIKRLTQQEVETLAKRFFDHKKAVTVRETLADKLGVTVASLELLRVGYGCDHNGREFASFPSRNGDGKVIGITRRYEGGEKKTYPGTQNGLFFVPGWWKYPGPVFIPEGPSDVAACVSDGLCAIGRSSNVGGVEFIKRALRRTRGLRRVVVIAERDEKPDRRGELASCPKACKGCAHCYPGLHGAKEVSRALDTTALSVTWVFPPAPFKDFREYSRSGGVWADLIQGF